MAKEKIGDLSRFESTCIMSIEYRIREEYKKHTSKN